MADKEKVVSYPRLPLGAWWALRKKFVQSMPGVVTTSYLAPVLNMKEDSARANVLPFLKVLGIIDTEGKVTDLAKRWRDDKQYPAVCKEMLESVYPEELRHIATNVSQREQAVSWFANKTGMGRVAARMMTSLYVVLLEADPSKQPGVKTEKKTTPTVSQKKAEKEHHVPTPPPLVPPAPLAPQGTQNSSGQLPGININLEIHISADSTPEQIEKIFESMSKHIYQRKG